MRGPRIERTLRLVGNVGLVVGMGMILVAGVVSITSAQEQLAAVPQAAPDDIKGSAVAGLDLYVPEMPFAERPGAAKSVQPDRWAWIEGCRRFVEARTARDAAIDWEIDGSAGRVGGDDAVYRRHRMLADCLASSGR